MVNAQSNLCQIIKVPSLSLAELRPRICLGEYHTGALIYACPCGTVICFPITTGQRNLLRVAMTKSNPADINELREAVREHIGAFAVLAIADFISIHFTHEGQCVFSLVHLKAQGAAALDKTPSKRLLEDISDNELVDAIASFGIEGCALEDDKGPDGFKEFCKRLKIALPENMDELFNEIGDRIYELQAEFRILQNNGNFGCSPQEWARRIVGKTEAEVSEILRGQWREKSDEGAMHVN